jgi:hypothetical protein
MCGILARITLETELHAEQSDKGCYYISSKIFEMGESNEQMDNDIFINTRRHHLVSVHVYDMDDGASSYAKGDVICQQMYVKPVSGFISQNLNRSMAGEL